MVHCGIWDGELWIMSIVSCFPPKHGSCRAYFIVIGTMTIVFVFELPAGSFIPKYRYFRSDVTAHQSRREPVTGHIASRLVTLPVLKWLHSPSLVDGRRLKGYGLKLAVIASCVIDLNIDGKTHLVHRILNNCNVEKGCCDRWCFSGHWQSPCTALTAGNLPAIRDVQGGWENV